MVDKIKSDLELIGLPTDFGLELRGYSKTYEGRYNPVTKTMILYTKDTPEGKPVLYKDLLKVAIHECIHHVQLSDPCFIRYVGVMHNPDFWKLYYKYIDCANEAGLFDTYRLKIKRRGNSNLCLI